MNSLLAHGIINQLKSLSICDIALCPGGRNIPLLSLLDEVQSFNKFYWYEERSAAFFALGKSRVTERPVAVVTTSGTAAGELLPSAMEAYYSGVPLLLITADRPKRFRGTGSPQTAEQVGLFGPYVTYCEDLALDQQCDLTKWDQKGPAHINICFEEPLIG